MKFLITEEEKSRILGLYKNTILKEQATPTGQTQTQPQIGGGNAASVMTIPGFKEFLKWNPTSNQYGFEANIFNNSMLKYLGGQQSMLSGILGKTILITKQKMNDYLKMERFALQNNSVDDFILGSFVPRAWYVGSAYPQNMGNASQNYLYLFNREITTNYSGDNTKPFIEKGGNSAYELEPSKASLAIVTKGDAGAKLPYVDNNQDIIKALRVNGLKPITDYIRIRIFDGYCPEYKGYADYLLYVGIPGLGSMVGVTKTA